MKSRTRLLVWAGCSVLAAAAGLGVATWPAGAASNAGTGHPHMKDGKVVPPVRPTVKTEVVPGMQASQMREAEHGHSKGGSMAPRDAVHRQNGGVWVD
ncbi:hypothetical protein C2I33_06720 [Ralstonia solanacearum]|uniref:hypothetical protein n=1 Tax=Ralstonia solanacearum TaxID=305 RepID=UPI0006CB5D11|nr:hypothetical protein [Ralstonia solanacearum]ALF89934.1 hypothetical protein RSUY_36240 [Ralstonia solanacearum]ATI29427.1 hypothetical protein CCY86_18140 [Ralstonia solanacearum]MBB6584542.1 hypothetical protein [Ralstonia solanacearum]MDC6178546.1 hypothetical protein [Ralstonia solanacearum]MDC6211065.1 hypothetical protein [Ralstonia solanacearum]